MIKPRVRDGPVDRIPLRLRPELGTPEPASDSGPLMAGQLPTRATGSSPQPRTALQERSAIRPGTCRRRSTRRARGSRDVVVLLDDGPVAAGAAVLVALDRPGTGSPASVVVRIAADGLGADGRRGGLGPHPLDDEADCSLGVGGLVGVRNMVQAPRGAAPGAVAVSHPNWMGQIGSSAQQAADLEDFAFEAEGAPATAIGRGLRS